MTKDIQEANALVKYATIAPLTTGAVTPVSNRAFFRDAAAKTYYDDDGKELHYAAATIERWYRLYKKHGFEGLLPQSRSDEGHFRALDQDLQSKIQYKHEQYPRLSAAEIRRQLIEEGVIFAKDCSESTVLRFIRSLPQSDVEENGSVEHRRYERAHINEVWCADTCYGPYLRDGKEKRRVFLIGIMDDASRYIVGMDIFFHDNFPNFMAVAKSAVSKYGVPAVWNLDNGSSYKNRQMQLLAARMGSSLNYCQPYRPQGKAKLQRWWRTMHEHWEAGLDMKKVHSLEELRTDLLAYVHKYNRTPHTSLDGKTPQERFFSESSRIRRLSTSDIDRFFLLELERKVSVDNVFKLENIAFQVDSRFSDQHIRIRCTPDFSEVYVLEKDDSLTPVRMLNKHENAVTPRKKVRLSDTEQEADDGG